MFALLSESEWPTQRPASSSLTPRLSGFPGWFCCSLGSHSSQFEIHCPQWWAQSPPVLSPKSAWINWRFNHNLNPYIVWNHVLEVCVLLIVALVLSLKCHNVQSSFERHAPGWTDQGEPGASEDVIAVHPMRASFDNQMQLRRQLSFSSHGASRSSGVMWKGQSESCLNLPRNELP